eukprot:scaffold10665_cov67-Phaeocystis_antarctica.AAC.3
MHLIILIRLGWPYTRACRRSCTLPQPWAPLPSGVAQREDDQNVAACNFVGDKQITDGVFWSTTRDFLAKNPLRPGPYH